MVLDAERIFFESHKQEWLGEHVGQYVLVKGSDLIGMYPDAQTAYSKGLAHFGLQPFLVKEVREEEPVIYVPLLWMN